MSAPNPKTPGRTDVTVRSRAKPAKLSRETLRQNVILAGLDEAIAELVVKAGALLYLPVRYTIYQANAQIGDVYFPIECVLSVVTTMENGNQIEIGTIGREGMSAIPLLMGATTTANESYCQVPGRAVRISATLFLEIKHDHRVRQLLDRYLQAYVNMLGQLAACNRLHNVHERCARWLLTTHDRVESAVIPLTHEFLAMMLGTQRSGVTIAAGTLQSAGFIKYSRGTITIIDRAGLEDASCECYAVAQKQFAGLLRPVDADSRREER